MSFKDVLSEVEQDFADLESWVADEASVVAKDLLDLGRTVAAAIEPLLFMALQDGVKAALAGAQAGESLGDIFTAVLNVLEPEAQAGLRAVESSIANGVLSLLVAKHSAPAPVS